jgi:hypothetical protein
MIERRTILEPTLFVESVDNRPGQPPSASRIALTAAVTRRAHVTVGALTRVPIQVTPP